MVNVPLDVVRVDAETQVRVKIDEDVVTNYAEAMQSGTVFPAIVLFHDGSAYNLADGFHRTLAAQRIGALEIFAEVRVGTRQDALWYALGANKHGQPLTRADKRHAIILALKAWPEKSINMIADQIGCARSYVQRIGDEVAPRGHVEARVTGKDGKSYPASRPAAQEIAPSHVRQPGVMELRRQRFKQMAEDGYSSSQIAEELGISRQAVWNRAAADQVDIKADRIAGNQKKPDANLVAERVALDIEGLAQDIGRIDIARLDPAQVPAWLAQIVPAVRTISAFVKRLKSLQEKEPNV